MDNRDLLEKIGVYYVAKLRSNLVADGSMASGDMYRSIKHNIVSDNILEVTSKQVSNKSEKDQLLAISEGTRPSTKNPSDEMVTRIVSWMKHKGMQPLVRRGKWKYLKNGKKVRDKRAGRFMRVTDSRRRKAAYAVARGILRNGIKGSRVISRSYQELESKIDKDVLDHFKMQIDEEFNKIIVKNANV